MRIANTIAVVIGAPLILWGLRAITRGITRLIPEGRVKDILTKERGVNARPNLASLRGGLK